MASKTILVIDDDQTVTEILKEHLKSNGYDVLISHNGEDGLELAKSKNPDAIILDWMLPGIDGNEVLKKLYRQHELKHIPVIMLTAKSEINYVSDSLDLGARDYIAKPFDEKNLIERIEKLFKHKD